MGLAERRAIKEFQDKYFADLQSEIHKAAGFAVPLEISWDQLAVEGQVGLYKEAWTDIFFKPVIEGLRQIGRDEMGKEALQAGLKKIEFRNSQGASSPQRAISFVSGTLVIDHTLSNSGDVKDRTRYVVEVVEKTL